MFCTFSYTLVKATSAMSLSVSFRLSSKLHIILFYLFKQVRIINCLFVLLLHALLFGRISLSSDAGWQDLLSDAGWQDAPQRLPYYPNTNSNKKKILLRDLVQQELT